MVRRSYAWMLLGSISFFMMGCGNSAHPPAGNMPPPEVSVVTVMPGFMRVMNELPGRLEATRVAQVRARVAGIVIKRDFQEGSAVQAGQVLFHIDPAPLQAAQDQARAAVLKAEATHAQAVAKLERYIPLVKTHAVSQQEYEEIRTAKEQAAAELAVTQAMLHTTQLNLAYATVTAPISGQVGRAQVTEGALVGQNEVTPLVTIQQIDTMYVNVTQSSAEWSRMQQAVAAGQLKKLAPDQVKVTLITEEGVVYPHSGKLLFSESTVDESTGAVLMRAEFPNPKHALLPGMFVRARVEQTVNERGITVPQQAVVRTPEGATVFVVGSGGIVTVRPIKTGSARGDSWVVTEGLQAGDQVIVEGLQKIKPGAVVKPVSWNKPQEKAA